MEASAEYAAQRDRVITQILGKEKLTFATFYARAGKQKCTCPTPGENFENLKQGIEFHDEKEFYNGGPKSKEIVGQWIEAALKEFPDRARVLSFNGEKGCGKSSVTGALEGLFLPAGVVDFSKIFYFRLKLRRGSRNLGRHLFEYSKQPER